MRRVIRILCLLRNQRRVELLIAIDIAGIDILRRLAIRSLLKIRLETFISQCGGTDGKLSLDGLQLWRGDNAL